MPLSSVSDFERFALKSKKRIAAKVKKTEEDASAYALQKEEAAQQEIAHWLRQSRAEWKQALSAKRKRGEKAISDEVKRGWSAYAKEHKTALEAQLKVRLGAEFPTLAACFIAWVSKKYETGVFTMPRAYAGSVKSEFFEVIECEDEQIVFTSGNLYIEYSVERIIEELADDIASCMRFGEAPWQG